MTGEQKLRTAFRLYWVARKLRAATLRDQHPDWTPEQVEQKVKEIFLHARIAAFPLDDLYRPPSEILRLEQQRAERGHFNLIHHETGFRADVCLARQDELHRWGPGHAREVSLSHETADLGIDAWTVTALGRGRGERSSQRVSKILRQTRSCANSSLMK